MPSRRPPLSISELEDEAREFLDRIDRESVTRSSEVFNTMNSPPTLAPVNFPTIPYPEDGGQVYNHTSARPPRPSRWKGKIVNITEDDTENTGQNVRQVDGVCLVNQMDSLHSFLFQKFLPVSKRFVHHMTGGDGGMQHFRHFWMGRGWIMQEAFRYHNRMILTLQKGTTPIAVTWAGSDVCLSPSLNAQLLVHDRVQFEAAFENTGAGVVVLIDVLEVGDIDKRGVPLHKRRQLLDALVSETPEMRFAKIAHTASQKRELAREQSKKQDTAVLMRMIAGTAFPDDIPGDNVLVGSEPFL